MSHTLVTHVSLASQGEISHQLALFVSLESASILLTSSTKTRIEPTGSSHFSGRCTGWAARARHASVYACCLILLVSRSHLAHIPLTSRTRVRLLPLLLVGLYDLYHRPGNMLSMIHLVLVQAQEFVVRAERVPRSGQVEESGGGRAKGCGERWLEGKGFHAECGVLGCRQGRAAEPVCIERMWCAGSDSGWLAGWLLEPELAQSSVGHTLVNFFA